MPSNVVDYQQNTGQNTSWFTVLPAALLSTATRTSNIMYNPSAKGMILSITTANEVGTCSFTPKICTLDAFGTVITLWTAAAAITTDTTSTYFISETTFTNASFTAVVATVLPRSWYLVLTYSGTPASDKSDTKASACYVI